MKEADLKRRLVKALGSSLPGAVIYRHEDTFTAGIPDISVTWGGITSWWEVKYEPLGRTSKATRLQLHELKRLGAETVSGLITYRDRKREGGQRVLIEVHGPSGLLDPIAITNYNHHEVAEVLRRFHFIARKEVTR